MNHKEEDELLTQASEISRRHFKNAEDIWENTPNNLRTRPWPRCHNINCNRTLVCNGNDKCEGWDF